MNRRLLVDLEALAANYQLFVSAAHKAAPQSNLRNLPGQAAVGGVVKANAYGVGMAQAAERLFAEGCRSFFVATVEEAFELRDVLSSQSGGDEPFELFIFDGVDSSNAADVARAGLIPVLNDETQLDAWRPHAGAPGAIHFDTGMHRLGFPSDTPATHFGGFNVGLVMTHLACADEPDSVVNAAQTSSFAEIVRRFPGVRTSIGNSAGWLSGCQGDLGRPGIGLYGGNPFSDRPSPMRPVASLQGRVLQLRDLAAGESVGYGASWTADETTRAATVAIGYADGVPRHLSGVGEMALTSGECCPILGRVSMDSTVIDVSTAPGVAVGDWVECFGVHISVDEAARRAGTLGYELLTRVGARVPRVPGALG